MMMMRIIEHEKVESLCSSNNGNDNTAKANNIGNNNNNNKFGDNGNDSNDNDDSHSDQDYEAMNVVDQVHHEFKQIRNLQGKNT